VILRRLPEVIGPVLLVLGAALLGLGVSTSLQTYFLDTLVKVSIVVALYVFIGNSGVLSFGHIAFVALGVWTAGVLTVPESQKNAIMPGLAHFLLHTNVGNIASLALAAAVGLVFAFIVGLPLMRLSGLAAGIATFGVLEIVNNLLRYWQSVGPGLNAFSSVPQTTGIWQAAVAAMICIVVAYAYQRSRFGRQLRAAREDPAAASAAGISLAMLVVGGSGSLLGAVLGALAVSGLDSFLSASENGVDVLGLHLDLPTGTTVIVIGTLMAVVLVLRPSGLSGGRELALPRRRRLADLQKARAST
jgi:branched-chain amino acid transport system permease protein